MKKLLITLTAVVLLVTAIGAGRPFQGIWDKLWELEARLDSMPPATSAEIESLGFVLAEHLPSFSYPDGIMGSTPLTMSLARGSGYIVPAGKNLYILGLSNQYIGGSVSLLVDGVRVAGLSRNYLNPVYPIVAGGTSTLSVSSGSLLLHGFLVDATISPVVASVLGTSAYTVPIDKSLYITSLYSVGAADVKIEGAWFIRLTGGLKSLGQPIIMSPGQAITAGGSHVTIIGYLR